MTSFNTRGLALLHRSVRPGSGCVERDVHQRHSQLAYTLCQRQLHQRHGMRWYEGEGPRDRPWQGLRALNMNCVISPPGFFIRVFHVQYH
jgi:hypothetical protein